MDVVAIERDFTNWLAEKLNLIVDKDIFRGGIPEKLDGCGVGVLFGAEVPVSGFYGFRPRTWNTQVLAKFDDRDAAMVFLSRLSGLFPTSNFTSGNTKFLTVTPSGASEPYQTDDDGKERTFVSFNVVLSVLTSGAQITNK